MIRSGRDLLRAALLRFVDGGGFLVGEAVGAHGVTAGFTKNLVRTPLSESSAIGVAAGLALGGKRVVVELVDPAGLARAADLLDDLAGFEARSGGAFGAPVVIRAPLRGAGGSPPATPPALAGRLVVAGTADDLAGLLDAAVASGKPTVILEAAGAFDDMGSGAACAPIGAAVVRRAGAEVTVLAAGDAVAAALAADTGATVVDVRALAPLDRATLADAVRATGRVVAVGVPAALDVATTEAFLSLESPPVALPADASPERIAAAVRDALSY